MSSALHAVPDMHPDTHEDTDDVTAPVHGLPRLHTAALHGPVGKAVRRIHPTTEAHPAGVLVQTLAMLGAMVGDGPHVMIGGSQHPARIWPLIIGPTGVGRKGESLAQAKKFVSSFNSFSSYFVEHCLASGLASGEGVVAHFADRTNPEDTQDRRLVVTEKEFARTLTASKRESSTLGPLLRTLWEEDSAQVMTRTDPLKASGVHLVVIGHITARELRMKLSGADVSGGTANRFLPIAVRQWQLLDDETQEPDLAGIAAELEPRLHRAHVAAPARYRRTEAAGAYWKQVYRVLCDSEVDGPLGEVLARAPAYVLRLALLYALIDGATAIHPEHIRAGLAIVKYAADTAKDVFGDLSGDSDLDKLSAGIRRAGPKGMTQTEVSALFGRNRSTEQINTLIAQLTEQGAAHMRIHKPARGRPTNVLVWNEQHHNDPITDLLTMGA
nr:DUF3987 domain-containing protein [Kibdelosporangium sp. MJ126-NF4]CEL15092.1 hypothetical protein [Kibdelosporangium sp. MJ126-NF4]CTQ93314.1 hypothetical protein [Kibdelosporangium sp. MJ126-NF4]